jgi:hypothetical protein
MSTSTDSSKMTDSKHTDGANGIVASGASSSAKTDSKEEKPKKRNFFGGKPGHRGTKGKPKKKPTKLPDWHLDQITNKVITDIARYAGCHRISRLGKLSFVNEWGYFLTKLMRHAERFSRAAGRKKTIEFMDVAQALDYFPHLRSIRLPNPNYKKDKDGDGSGAKRPTMKHFKKKGTLKKDKESNK